MTEVAGTEPEVTWADLSSQLTIIASYLSRGQDGTALEVLRQNLRYAWTLGRLDGSTSLPVPSHRPVNPYDNPGE